MIFSIWWKKVIIKKNHIIQKSILCLTSVGTDFPKNIFNETVNT